MRFRTGFLPCAGGALLLAAILFGCGSGKEGRETLPDEKPEIAGDDRAQKAGAGATEQDAAALVAEGKVAWRSCAACHCATDPRIPEDADWVLMNETTTCIASGAPAPRLRSAIIAYLEHEETLRPLLVTEDFEAPDGMETGAVAVPQTAGSAYLKANRESIRKGSPPMVRLVWSGTETGGTLLAPAGEYVVINYWLYRPRAEGKERWMATVTNVDGCATLVVTPGTESIFFLDPVVYGSFSAEKTESGFLLAFHLSDIGANRLTLSRNGQVVFPRYRIRGPAGDPVAEGVFEVT